MCAHDKTLPYLGRSEQFLWWLAPYESDSQQSSFHLLRHQQTTKFIFKTNYGSNKSLSKKFLKKNQFTVWAFDSIWFIEAVIVSTRPETTPASVATVSTV